MDSWSTDDGIMWLWPISTEQFSIFNLESHAGGVYGVQFYAKYIKTPRLILPEIIIVAAGIIAVIRTILNRYFSQHPKRDKQHQWEQELLRVLTILVN